MRVLVFGAGGMAGHVMALYMQEYGIDVTGFARQELTFCDTITGDALDRNAVTSAITAVEYDAVINCTGVLNTAVDLDPVNGIYINGVLPHFLAQLTKNRETRVVHLSTDCVFRGRIGGNYEENSFRDADSLYGRSKALGELNDNKNLTFRTSIVGPEMKNGIGLFHWFMNQTQTISGYTDAIWSGVTTITLAKAVTHALRQGLSGVYHLANNQVISKYELLCMFNALRKTPIEIIADDSVHINKSLINTRHDFDFAVPSYSQMMEEMAGWIGAHANLYPHYAIKER